jgi:hypothetical protein
MKAMVLGDGMVLFHPCYYGRLERVALLLWRCFTLLSRRIKTPGIPFHIIYTSRIESE